MRLQNIRLVLLVLIERKEVNFADIAKVMSNKFNKMQDKVLPLQLFESWQNKYIILITFIFLCFHLDGQTDKEAVVFGKIEGIDYLLTPNEGTSSTDKTLLKELKKISKEAKGDLELSAVTNAVIAKTLANKGHYKAANYYFKKAWELREVEGKYLPQRWALNGIIENASNQNDIATMLKYTKAWISLVNKTPLAIGAKKVEPIYDVVYNGDKYLNGEIEQLWKQIHPVRIWRGQENRYDNWEDRRKYAHAFFKFLLKEFPEDQMAVVNSSKEFYDHIISKTVREKDIKAALEWKDKALKLMKGSAPKDGYTDMASYLSTLFRLRTGGIWAKGIKTKDYEYIGIDIMENYIKHAKKIKRIDQILFGYRYIATRYMVLRDYKKATQYLATAIKYCNSSDLKKEIKKSYGGLHVMLQEIQKRRDMTGLRNARSWKDNYSLKGMTVEDVKRMDSILLEYN